MISKLLLPFPLTEKNLGAPQKDDFLAGTDENDLLVGDLWIHVPDKSNIASSAKEDDDDSEEYEVEGEDDKLYGKGGEDILVGDVLITVDGSYGNGPFNIEGELEIEGGRDKLYGGNDNDELIGDAEIVIDGGDATFNIEGELGIKGGRDKLYGGNDNDELIGDAEIDFKFGGESKVNLTFEGEGGKDILKGGEGDDEIVGDVEGNKWKAGTEYDADDLVRDDVGVRRVGIALEGGGRDRVGVYGACRCLGVGLSQKREDTMT